MITVTWAEYLKSRRTLTPEEVDARAHSAHYEPEEREHIINVEDIHVSVPRKDHTTVLSG